MKLPNCEQALVQEIKLTGYLLNEENSKGKSYLYNRIGFTVTNASLLSNALTTLACSGEVTGTQQTEFGLKYFVVGELMNPMDRHVVVLSIWIFDQNGLFPRFVTAYPN
ncbi:DUF6883 domain-containing protein [Fibrella aquatica]|uniref:DUF6883 domain-containing protein n=1 Tax=Fibrella aquatica TaxID=3242487 RepID=UPI0035226520